MTWDGDSVVVMTLLRREAVRYEERSGVAGFQRELRCSARRSKLYQSPEERTGTEARGQSAATSSVRVSLPRVRLRLSRPERSGSCPCQSLAAMWSPPDGGMRNSWPRLDDTTPSTTGWRSVQAPVLARWRGQLLEPRPSRPKQARRGPALRPARPAENASSF